MTRPSRTPVREVRLFLSGPPGAVLDRFEAALRRAGSFLVTRGPWSLGAAPLDLERIDARDASVDAGDALDPKFVVAGGRTPGPGTLPVGGAQIALVPVQADPSNLRAWVTWVPGASADAISIAVDAYLSSEKLASRSVQATIEARERRRDDDAAWLAQAANIRRALEATGLAHATIESRLDASRARWAQTRQGAVVEEDEPPPA